MKRLFIAALATVLTVHSVGFGLLALPERANASGLGDPPPVVINEVMWMGTDVSNADEWIELYSKDGYTVGAGGLTLSVGGVSYVIPEGTVIAPNGYYLVANRNTLPTARDVSPDYQIPSNAIWISNTCSVADIKLINELAETIDSVGCNAGDLEKYFFHDASVKHALERRVDKIASKGTTDDHWQIRAIGHANIQVSSVSAGTRATPKAPNVDAPVGSVINDGISTDIDSQLNNTQLSANWEPFTSTELGIARYEIGYAMSGSNVTSWADVGLVTKSNITGLSLTLNTDYIVAVRAINTLGIFSESIVTDGVKIVDGTITGITAIDTPNDNGGSIDISWSASEAQDLTGYEIQYRPAGTLSWQSVDAGLLLTKSISGLDNSLFYEFEIRGYSIVAGNPTQYTPWSKTTDPVQSVDNLAPVLDSTKLLLSQNAPGTQDAFSGLAGAVNEKSTISLYKSSVISSDNLISSVESSVDGSIAGTLLGDNMFGEIWVVAKDAANNSSAAIKLTNDIVAPNAPTLTALSSNCNTSTCRVTLAWSDNGPDTTGYRVQYTVDGALTTVANLSSTELLLDLPEGKNYEFAVIAYDAAGNLSALSNKILVGLNRGVNVNATFVNGSLVIDTSAVEESIVPIPATGGLGDVIVPSARASDFALPEDVSTEVAGAQDWGRVFTVVFLMLIVASGFYALSRQIKDTPQLDAATPKEVKRSKSPPPKAPTAPKSAGRASPKRRPRRKR